MTFEDFGNNQVISDYIYKNKESIPIINVVKVTKEIVGRLDIIIFEYCDGKMEFLPILMDFNKIANPFDVKIGTMLNIPDYQYIISSIGISTIEEKVPGVSNSMDCVQQNLSNLNDGTTSSNYNGGKEKSVAVPKLNISLKKVSYNSTTGVISY